MRILIVTTVHHPVDARLARLSSALRDAGHAVTLAAPYRDFGVELPRDHGAIDIPRSAGRRRLRAIVAAHRTLRRVAKGYDAVVVADPELTVVARRLDHPCVVWDVQEDTAAAVTLKPWLPGPLRRPTAAAIRRLESRAEDSMHLILAEEAYAERFRGRHPVVPNSTWVPEVVAAPGPGRAIYVGSLSVARGALDMIAVGEELRGEVAVHLVGAADDQTAGALARAHAEGAVTWHGFMPNAQALGLVEGATVGLSLLHDEPNYRHSRPTKILEYFSRGIPVVSTPLPAAADLIARSGAGVTVPFCDPRAAADAVRRFHREADLRSALGGAGLAWVRERFDWTRDGARWVALMEEWSARSQS